MSGRDAYFTLADGAWLRRRTPRGSPAASGLPTGSRPAVGAIADNGRVSSAVPPGWPDAVPHLRMAGARHLVVARPLSPDYRGMPGGAGTSSRLPVATRHIEAQLVAMRQAYREAQVELDDLVPADGLAQRSWPTSSPQAYALAAKRSAGLLYDALQGKRYVPRL